VSELEFLRLLTIILNFRVLIVNCNSLKVFSKKYYVARAWSIKTPVFLSRVFSRGRLGTTLDVEAFILEVNLNDEDLMSHMSQLLTEIVCATLISQGKHWECARRGWWSLGSLPTRSLLFKDFKDTNDLGLREWVLALYLNRKPFILLPHMKAVSAWGFWNVQWSLPSPSCFLSPYSSLSRLIYFSILLSLMIL
jgi:hypothetical protein